MGLFFSPAVLSYVLCVAEFYLITLKLDLNLTVEKTSQYNKNILKQINSKVCVNKFICYLIHNDLSGFLEVP